MHTENIVYTNLLLKTGYKGPENKLIDGSDCFSKYKGCVSKKEPFQFLYLGYLKFCMSDHKIFGV